MRPGPGRQALEAADNAEPETAAHPDGIRSPGRQHPASDAGEKHPAWMAGKRISRSYQS